MSPFFHLHSQQRCTFVPFLCSHISLDSLTGLPPPPLRTPVMALGPPDNPGSVPQLKGLLGSGQVGRSVDGGHCSFCSHPLRPHPESTCCRNRQSSHVRSPVGHRGGPGHSTGTALSLDQVLIPGRQGNRVPAPTGRVDPAPSQPSASGPSGGGVPITRPLNSSHSHWLKVSL